MARILRITERAADGTIISFQDRTGGSLAKDPKEAKDPALIFSGPSHPSIPSRDNLPSPTIGAMLANFSGSMLRWAGAGFATVDEPAFRLRLAQCRACEFWDESARFTAGKCNHPHCGCTRAKLWLASERCPISHW